MKIDIIQLEFIDQKLRNMIVWLEKETGLEFTITSLYRMNDSGVHGTLPLRGMDLRCRNKLIGKEIERLIDVNWVYDKGRPEKSCILIHGNGYNLHIHLQVCAKTEQI